MGRRKNTKSSKLVVIIVLAIIYLVASLLDKDEQKVREIERNALVNITENLQVHFIDVGQADAILITQGDNSMLIDAGEYETADEVNNYISSQGISKLDYVVETHPHSDHIGAMYTVIDNFDVGRVIMSGKRHTTKTYENLLKSISKKNVQKIDGFAGDRYDLGKASFEIIGPTYDSGYGDNLNDYSLVIKLTYGNNTFLFTGDAEEKSEDDMLNSNVNLRCDVLKVGHHGSGTATTDEFFHAVNPNYAVISVGQDNSYGLPDKRVMDLFKNNFVTVYRTDESGTIIATSDGNEITFDQSPGTYNYVD